MPQKAARSVACFLASSLQTPFDGRSMRRASPDALLKGQRLQSIHSQTSWEEFQAPPRSPQTKDLTADVVVVGAGVTGLTAALLLQLQGKRVVVLEALRIGAGTTGGTTAHI